MKKRGLILSILSLTFASLCASCSLSNDNGNGTTGDLVDYVEQVKLNLDYKGHDFLTEGIGEVTLMNSVDGDTAHFKTIDLGNGGAHDLTVKARFLGIDTPESTSKIEPWGKAASKFTAEKLNKAAHIVLSSAHSISGEYSPADKDSYGRSLSFVWVTEVANPELTDYKLLNLWLVQESYSGAKGTTQLGEYAKYFIDADAQAQKQKIRIWSKEHDPDFNYGDAQLCSLVDIYINIDETTGLSAFNGVKITTRGIVTRIIGNSSYIQYTFEPDESNELTAPKTLGLYLFTLSSIKPMAVIGNDIEVTGTLSYYNGSYQLSGILYNQWTEDPLNNTHVLSKDNPVEPINISSVEDGKDLLGVLVSVNDLYATGGYGGKLEFNSSTNSYNDDNDMTVYCNIGSNGRDNQISLRIPSEVNVKDIGQYEGSKVESYKFFAGGTTDKGDKTYKAKKFSVVGVMEKYITTNGKETYQIKLCKNADLLNIEEVA